MCRACSSQETVHLDLCEECLAKLEHGTKIRAINRLWMEAWNPDHPALYYFLKDREIKRIRQRKFTDDEISLHLASVLTKRAKET